MLLGTLGAAGMSSILVTSKKRVDSVRLGSKMHWGRYSLDVLRGLTGASRHDKHRHCRERSP